ncbi:ornithine cyclodeaminase [Promicromonospora thailandica]|uniref:Ornithine cyclodeaminase n=1 Tax=Promicromonospora thailandica TaxID=765201 RepID=A0A9X2FXQ8_9MICO|nr:ornithine cyclodeaminase [Promicromonospora thailandica]MCP2263212.1 ornithine cyclodeaminase [Promicromonospora thailandica]BFF18600.1 ornithine cyclodeaminase [Promicromonospora thailandica]
MTTVPYLDVAATARWVARRGPEAAIAALTDALERDFARWPELDKRPRIASHSAEGVIELMPTSDAETYGFKLVNGHPLNPSRGYQTVTAVGMLASVHNGYPTFLAEMTLLTALRTAATSALAARYLAPASSRTLALIGCGSQAEFQALGMRAELGIETLRVFDVDRDAMEKLAKHAKALGFDVVLADDAADAARGADVVTTCTADKQNATVLQDADVTGGVFINAIGGDCPGKTELDPATVARASVFVELPEQTRIEGEIQRQAPDFPVTELWQVVTGVAPGRRSADELVVWDSVGFALEDWTALRFVLQDVTENAPELLGHLDLIAEPENPKDLYSLVADA